MKILYLDCTGGVSDRTLVNCLLNLVDDPQGAADELNRRFRGQAEFSLRQVGSALELSIEENGSAYDEECEMPDYPDRAVEALGRILRYEEYQDWGYGTMSGCWASAAFLLAEKLRVDRIISSPVNLGQPVDTGAARMLTGKPVISRAGGISTVRGAAFVAEMANEFGAMPTLTLQKSAESACEGARTAALLGDSADRESRCDVIELTCSLDDMKPEDLGFASEVLLDAGALDVYTVPLHMKKSRPGALLCVTCSENKQEEMLGLIFRHTTTLGVRKGRGERFALERHVETMNTELGDVRRKISQGYGVRREKWEYDDLARIARERSLSLDDVRIAAEKAVNKLLGGGGKK